MPNIAHPLQLLQDVGLGDLTLGRSSPTLSGGEASASSVNRRHNGLISVAARGVGTEDVHTTVSDSCGESIPVENRDVQGIEGLLHEVLAIAGELPDGHFLWFRGLDCATHQLLPKIMRDGKTSGEVFDREKRLLTRFRQRSMAYWPAGYPQNEWEHLFVMQHFGMPTRLLDWSENAFVAAHFALTIPSAHAHEGECIPTICCLDPVEWNRSIPVLSEYGESIQVLTTADEELEAYRPMSTKRRTRSPIAMFGAHNSARIVAQRGTFIVWGNDPQSLEAFAAEQSARVWRLRLLGDREDLAQQLRHLGFSETMVFPELPSLSVELSRAEGWK